MLHLRSVLQRCNRFAMVFNGSRRTFSTTRLCQGYDSEGVMNEEERRAAFQDRMRQRDEMFAKYWIPKGTIVGIVAFIALMIGMQQMVKKAEEAADATRAKSLTEKELSEKEQLGN